MGQGDDYYYTRMDFRRDPKMRAPMGCPWGNAGMFVFYATGISNYVF